MTSPMTSLTSGPTSTRTRRTHRTRTALTAGLAAFALLGLSACSEEPAQDATDIVADAQAQDYRDDQAESQRVREAYRQLPQPTSGTVRISGNRGSLTPDEVFAFNQSGTSTDVSMTYDGEDAAFAALCSGEIDIVDSSREVTRAELEACRRVGLDLVQFQVASDAIVVATKNESDVGGDCLSTDQVREIYRAGSPVTRWSQLGDGFDDVPLKVGGPNRENNAFTFFGQYVLGAPQPAMTNLRSDYRAFDTDQGSRLFVVGREKDYDLAGKLRERSRKRELIKQQLSDWYPVVNDAKDEVQVAREEVAKGQRDQRPLATQQADQARLQRAIAALEAAQRRMRVLEARKREITAVWERSVNARKRVQASRGNVAYFRFSYYELFEEQLRPFEITTPEGERNCIFPSQQTITSGEYPLARRMLLTTTQRSLERNEVAEFLLHYLKNAEDDATRARLVSVPAADIEVQKAWVTGDAEPVFVELDPEPIVTTDEQPSTSLQPAR
ncbi:substrate-binding domain-containing protein [uncultured Nocardioides sp.]|jgi:ABC-type phosphate transport system substrate-binding protein|uniref:PstS family phosphate ABC transporter substrate-binding protein n=1 Tax=uncultured Nocardioides sp. TaxID=198441 RepID=UPI000C53EA39|nr:hypothetical protein [Nocardioides sp.]MCK5929814.1 substrate-binding domain-containing protein [Nocardioides sp.]|tara:strand:+ start:663 stop:2162 length:1500 start_codon:yes stop_codon:yes gene_type:complete